MALRPSPPAPADLPEREPSGDGELLPAPLRAWMRLLAAAGAIEQQLRSRVKDTLDVSHDEFLVLCLLADQPGSGLRMTQIAELLGRPRRRPSGGVSAARGLITRRWRAGDWRGIEVALTDKARRLLRSNGPAGRRRLAGHRADGLRAAVLRHCTTCCWRRGSAQGGDTAPAGAGK